MPIQAGGRVRLPHRYYYLYRGDLSAASALVPQPWNLRPNLWWPEDQAWCVATEIDLVTTFVGGAQGLVDAIAGDAQFVTVPVTPDEPLQPGRDY